MVLFAPSILAYEVLNGLLVAERMGRIAEEVTEEAFHAFLELEINFQAPMRFWILKL